MKRVLVIDDEFAIAETCADVLRWDGFEVTVVGDGAQALTVIRTHGPDILLLDYMMPVMDGLELLRTVRADPKLKTVRAVLMTAVRLQHSPDRHLWDALLLKPFNADQLLNAVRQQVHASSR